MYELKKIGKVFTSKFVGTEPSSCEKKKNLPGRGLTKVEKHWCKVCGFFSATDIRVRNTETCLLQNYY